ncbi:MAG: RNB domain-containing ribonuclease [Myxococcales bacterium]|nr:RNB domain-containing ribonuclease [Myxococcales bacterium]
MDAVPQPGTVVRVTHAGQSVLAVVLGERRGRAQVRTESGAELELSAAKIDQVYTHKLASPEALASFVGEVRAAAEETGVETLWELLQDEVDTWHTPEELAAMWFGEYQPVELFALYEVLGTDAVYFKSKQGKHQPRPPGEVEALKRQFAAAAEKEQTEGRFLRDVAQALDASEPLPEVGKALSAEVGTRGFVDLIWDYATHGDLLDRKPDAVALLEQLDNAASARVGRSPKSAFKVLLSLGLVSKHENLALRRYGIREEFSDDVVAEAEQAASSEVDWSSVTDFSEACSVTVDDPSTKDMDDAIHVRTLPSGQTEVGVHITDVASLVSPESPLDLEARRRGASVYTPSGSIPMLPKILSEKALSLIAGERRPVLSYVFTLGPDGELESKRIELGVIRVAERLSYEDAEAHLEDADSSLHEMFRVLADFTDKLRQARTEAGAVEIDLPEIRPKVSGDSVSLVRTLDLKSRGIISELMIAAGQSAADYCLRHGIPAVFRVQEAPGEGFDSDVVQTLPVGIVRSLEQVRHMRRGELRSSPGQHAGLGLGAYTQVTSPIRRYADLVMNYQLRCHLRGEPLAFDAESIVSVAGRAEVAASAANAAQRDSERYWLLEYLDRHRDEPVEAMALYTDRDDRRNRIPVVLSETMLRTFVQGRRLEPGELAQVTVVKADSRSDMVKVDLR